MDSTWRAGKALRRYGVSPADRTPGREMPDCIKRLKDALEQAQLW
jgi:hypothetical protein